MSRVLPDPGLPWPLPIEAVGLIAESEGLRLKAYPCPAGVWTIGWGETEGVKPGDVCTKEQADAMLLKDLGARVAAVQAMLTQYANPYQLGALVSLAYNIGLRDDKRKRGLYYSSVLRLHNAGDYAGAARAFDLINKYRDPQDGQLKVSAGLTRRRKAEAALYLTPEDGVPAVQVPQEVAPESSLAKSPIAQAGAATTLTGGLTVLATLGDQAETVSSSVKVISGAVKSTSEAVGLSPGAMLGGALLFIGLVAAYQRYKQRRDGWA